MPTNPLFPNEDDKQAHVWHAPEHEAAHSPRARNLKSGRLEAVNLLRQKLQTLYAKEPSARQELAEVDAEPKPFSKHQRFMQELSGSGKSLAEIQVAWHDYYDRLPDGEKHEVWQEFYDSQAQASHYGRRAAEAISSGRTSGVTPATGSRHKGVVHETQTDRRAAKTIQRQILDRVNMQGKLTAKHHFKSLGFGLATGSVVTIIFLFSFFNEIIIAPFIQPSRDVGSTPLIVNASGIAATNKSEVIIPKINVEIPVNYSQTTDNEAVIENALEDGVVHYPSTVVPGQDGNAAFFGHSSNNIFNPGKYKFAFVLLHKLVPGDTFYLTYKGKVYVYQVISKKIVPPSDVGVLNDTDGKTATATLITCDPPGTSINRLVVLGEQISPSVAGNSSAGITAVNQPSQLASNGPSLWSRFWNWLF